MTGNDRMASRIASGLLLLAALVARVAAASESSILITSEGLEQFHAGHYAEALAQFDRAVEADQTDVTALYYQAVTLGRLGAYDRAEKDLRHLLELRPDFAQGDLELGIVLVHAGRNEEAIPWLERAQASADVQANASFYLGVAELRLEHYRDALENFRRAGLDPSQSLAARFYEGRVHYEAREWPEADRDFSSVSTESPHSDMGREAERFRALIRDQGSHRYALHASMGFEYDSNVVLAPSSDEAKDALAISNQADGSAIFAVGGSYVPWQTEHARLSVGYEFFQSTHFKLTDFNLQDHRPSLDLQAVFAPIELGVSARYDYYRLGNASFLNQATGLPWIRFREGSFGYTDLYYRMRRRDFLQHRFGERLDGFNHAGAIVQTVLLGSPERWAWVGYRFDRQDSSHAQGNMFAYDGHQAESGMTWVWPDPAVSASLSYHYRYESYDGASGGRRDEEHGLSIATQKTLSEHVAVRVGYAGTFNNSNQSLFEYRRHIGTIALDVSF
jgi:tetratricopeptide (TPR) repeat protein